jgi:hypothetical protein
MARAVLIACRIVVALGAAFCLHSAFYFNTLLDITSDAATRARVDYDVRFWLWSGIALCVVEILLFVRVQGVFRR